MSSGSHSALFRSDHIDTLRGNFNPVHIAAQLYARRQLLWQFTLREVQGRYRGSYLGMVWALITPIIMLMVYTLIFHSVFNARWVKGDLSEHFMTYAMNMFSGIIAYNIFSESVSRAPLLIVQNPNLVKKVVFPLELLPVSLVGSALIHSFLSLVILLVGAVSGVASVHWTLVLLPVAVLPLVLFSMGCCWLLSSLGVFLRDIGNVVTVVVSLLFFLTPITYSPAQVPISLKAITRLNPLALMIENFRRVVNQGKQPDWPEFWVTMVVAVVFAMGGYAWFMKIKRAFADVI